MTRYTSYSAPVVEHSPDPPRAALGGIHDMWQIYAMMAQDQIREQHHEADLRRLSHEQPRPIRQRRHLHLPAVIRHPARHSSRTA